MKLLKVLSLFFLVLGFGMVFLAATIVKKYQLDKNTKCSFADELTEEELQKYKVSHAVLKIKMIGFAISLPGVVMILYAYK
ncbi:MAG: hypothetical protein N2645_12430 [Clostridia bacterium]|nr:hypothetical protein [Clostridia bacterium]